MLWYQGLYTEREATANRRDIRIKNKKYETCILRDMAMPEDRSVTQKETEKKLNTRVYLYRYNECGTRTVRLYRQ
jgi:hypothetical protein